MLFCRNFLHYLLFVHSYQIPSFFKHTIFLGYRKEIIAQLMLFDGVTVLGLANLLSLIDYFMTLTLNRQKRLITLVLTQLKFTDSLSARQRLVPSDLYSIVVVQHIPLSLCPLIMSQGVSNLSVLRPLMSFIYFLQ